MPECVTGGRLCETRRLHGYTEAALNHAFVQMVPSLLACDGVAIASRCRKDPLPCPFSSGIRILRGKGTGEGHVSGTQRQISTVLLLDVPKVFLQRRAQPIGKQRAAVLPAFPSTHRNLPRGEVEILDSELGAFQKAQASAIHQHRHKLWNTVHAP